MGIKKIFRDGMREFKRQSALRKEKRNLSEKEKLLSGQLTQLGKKAWESKLDIDSYGNSKELITNAQDQMNELNALLSNLQNQKEELEKKKNEENESFNSQNKVVEGKKREVDMSLDGEKKQLNDVQREVVNAGNRLSQIAREEEQLKTKSAASETTEEEKSEIAIKLIAFKTEKEEQEKKRDAASGKVKTVEEKIKPLEKESAKLQGEIDQIRDEQKKITGELDESLSKVNKEVSDTKNKLSELDREQDRNFEQLGGKLAAAQITDEAVISELGAVNDTKKEMEEIQVDIQSLEHQGTSTTRSALWKMIGLIAAVVVVVIGIIVVLVMLLGSDEKVQNSPFDEIEKKENKVPMTQEDVMKKMDEITGNIKESSEKMRGEKIVVADKGTLISVLPEISGWKTEGTSYSKRNFGQLEYSDLETDYIGPNGEKVSVHISDTATASAMLRIHKMVFRMNMHKENDKGYEKISTYNDIRVIEKYTKKTPEASFVFIVKERYLLELRYEGDNPVKLLKEFMTKFDFSKLK